MTKAPFEPLKKASLKHLTFKAVFLLALASGKRRSKIHVWVNRHRREDWSQVSLYPCEGPNSVAPVVVPALAPALEKSLRVPTVQLHWSSLHFPPTLDKSLHYATTWTELRTSEETNNWFSSLLRRIMRGHFSATISSWIKQSVLLCYKPSDQEAPQVYQVKPPDVRAFANPKGIFIL